MSTRTQMIGAMFGSGGSKDDEWENVALLLNGETGDPADGAQNSTFLDSSGAAKTLTPTGSPLQGSFNPYKNNWSVGKGSSGVGIYSMASGANLVSATGDFTVEMWVQSDGSTNALFAVNSTSASNPTRKAALRMNGDGGLYSSTDGVNWDVYLNEPTASIGDRRWHHVALVRDGTVFSVFVDGTRCIHNTSFTSSLMTPSGTLDLFHIGGSSTWQGNPSPLISNLRITNTVVYDPTSASLTVPTSALTAISGTQILTCASNRFEDLSTNAYAASDFNPPVFCLPMSPFPETSEFDAATGSIECVDEGYVVGPTSDADFAFGTGAYTVEAWIYMVGTDSSGNAYIFSAGDASGSFLFYCRPGIGDLFLGSQGVANLSNGGSTVAVGKWMHVIVVRESTASNKAALFIDGARVSNFTDSTNWTVNTTPAIGGSAFQAGSELLGYISDLRVVKGTAVYDVDATTLTVPTAPLTDVSGTVLLVRGNNAGIQDAAQISTVAIGGDTQIDTSQAKFGTRSIYFDGTGETGLSINTPSGGLNIGTSDFTIEGWLRRLSGPTTFQGLVDFRPDGTSGGVYPSLFIDDSTGTVTGTPYAIYYYADGLTRISSSAVPAVGSWEHFAVARESGTTRLFLGGVLLGSFADSFNYLTVVNRPVIGDNSYSPGASPLKGWLDDVRVTIGAARYTAAFTPPDRAFPISTTSSSQTGRYAPT